MRLPFVKRNPAQLLIDSLYNLSLSLSSTTLCAHFLASVSLAVAVAIHRLGMSATDIHAVLIPCLILVIVTI